MSESEQEAPNPFAGTTAPVGPDAPAVKAPPVVLRGLARVIDLLLQVAILEVAYRALPYLPVKGLVELDPEVLGYVDMGVGLFTLWLYCFVSEALGGATLGKAVTALRVVDYESRGRVSVKGSAIRNAIFFVDALLFGMVAYSQMARSAERRRGGDVAAGSLVVWTWDAKGSSLVGWPVGLLVGFGFVMLSYVVTG